MAKQDVNENNLSTIELKGIADTKASLDQAIKDDPLLLIRPLMTENQTLRDLARSKHQSFSYAVVVSIVAICAAVAGFMRDIEFRYFYINEKGHVYETSGLKYPTATYSTVINFAEEVAVKLHTWTYKNYSSNFPKLLSMCNNETLNAYVNKLANDGVFDAAERMVQHYDGIATAAKIMGEKPIDSDGRLAWQVAVKVNEDVTGSMDPLSNSYNMMIDIQQVPLSVSPQGLQCVRIDENITVKK